MSFVAGIDVGGTFTDCAIMDHEGRISNAKAPSTPPDFSTGAVESLRLAGLTRDLGIEEISKRTAFIVHGTTVADNAFLTRTGSKTGIITTVGHKDAILIMRGGMGRVAGLTDYELQNPISTSKPEPLVPRSLIEEVTERVDVSGKVVVSLRDQEVKTALRKLVSSGVEAIAVSFLWSFMNSKHEMEVKKLVSDEYPQIYVSVSSELVPVLGEYERTATTAINSYVGPQTSSYISTMRDKLTELGFNCPLLIMHADGGVTYPKEVVPVKTIQSGPVAGVVASKYLASLLGYEDVIATDMGGTSFKLALLINGDYSFSREFVFGQYHILTPSVDVVSIGSGGGSYVWLDSAGSLRVGPGSAGAVPGPVCYGLGGEIPTVTDADLLLGYLDPKGFLGGSIMLDVERTHDSMKRIADQLSMDPIEVASGVYTIVNSQMADLIRKATIERGRDPREYTLFSYGGAGPIHVCGFASELNIGSILVPNTSAVHSAFGLVTSNIVHSYEMSDPIRSPFQAERFEKNFERIETLLLEKLRRENVQKNSISFTRNIKMRYRRQVHVIDVPVPNGRIDDSVINMICDAFDRKYSEMYGSESGFGGAGIECVSFGVVASGATGFAPKLAKYESFGTDASHALKNTRAVYFPKDNDFTSTRIYDGKKLKSGNSLQGPAIIEMPTTAVVVQEDQRVTVDPYLNFIMRSGK